MSDVIPLPCQRHLFEMPDTVCYLDAAAWCPLPLPVRESGEAGMRMKRTPWSHPRDGAEEWAERARAAAARLIGADADDVAIVGSVSHAMATVARNLALAPGGRILRVADEFPSLCYAFDRLATERGLSVEVVARPADGDWTAALLPAITRPDAAPLALATLTPLHWTDGSVIDLDRLAPAVRAAGAVLVVDATQAVGAAPVDVRRWQPDYLAFPTYKWALGPYSLAFLYAAPHRQDGQPLEVNNGNRGVLGARRYDRGERNDPVALPMAATGLELIAGWGVERVSARLRDLTDRLALGLAELDARLPPPALRSAQIMGLRPSGGVPPGLIERLRSAGIFVSERSGGLRLSPNVWTREADIDRCVAALSAALPRA